MCKGHPRGGAITVGGDPPYLPPPVHDPERAGHYMMPEDRWELAKKQANSLYPVKAIPIPSELIIEVANKIPRNQLKDPVNRKLVRQAVLRLNDSACDEQKTARALDLRRLIRLRRIAGAVQGARTKKNKQKIPTKENTQEVEGRSDFYPGATTKPQSKTLPKETTTNYEEDESELCTRRRNSQKRRSSQNAFLADLPPGTPVFAFYGGCLDAGEFKGVIERYRGFECYDVRYDDGDDDKMLNREFIRPADESSGPGEHSQSTKELQDDDDIDDSDKSYEPGDFEDDGREGFDDYGGSDQSSQPDESYAAVYDTEEGDKNIDEAAELSLALEASKKNMGWYYSQFEDDIDKSMTEIGINKSIEQFYDDAKNARTDRDLFGIFDPEIGGKKRNRNPSNLTPIRETRPKGYGSFTE